MVPRTSRVDVVPMVWRTMGCSEPNLTGPAVTVRVGRRSTVASDSQYLKMSRLKATGCAPTRVEDPS